jgi:hypothetical protein
VKTGGHVRAVLLLPVIATVPVPGLIVWVTLQRPEPRRKKDRDREDNRRRWLNRQPRRVKIVV